MNKCAGCSILFLASLSSAMLAPLDAHAVVSAAPRKIILNSVAIPYGGAYTPAIQQLPAQVQGLPNNQAQGSSFGLQELSMASGLAGMVIQALAPDSEAAGWSKTISGATAALARANPRPSSASNRLVQMASLTQPNGGGFSIPPQVTRDFQRTFEPQNSPQRPTQASAPSSAGSLSNLNIGPVGDGSMGALSLASAKSLEASSIGRGQGFSLRSIAGWAKLQSDGSVRLPKGASHCTSSTHAAFLTTMGQLGKQGVIKLNDKILQTLNGAKFRDTWNSNGYGPIKLFEMLGGQAFKDRGLAKPGDLLKIDRGNKTGHMGIFSHFKGDQVCYVSSQSATRGTGPNCERIQTLTFARLTDSQNLQTQLNNLDTRLSSDSSLADVRARGGNGFVSLKSLALKGANQLRQWASLTPEKTQVSRTTAALQ